MKTVEYERLGTCAPMDRNVFNVHFFKKKFMFLRIKPFPDLYALKTDSTVYIPVLFFFY